MQLWPLLLRVQHNYVTGSQNSDLQMLYNLFWSGRQHHYITIYKTTSTDKVLQLFIFKHAKGMRGRLHP